MLASHDYTEIENIFVRRIASLRDRSEDHVRNVFRENGVLEIVRSVASRAGELERLSQQIDGPKPGQRLNDWIDERVREASVPDWNGNGKGSWIRPDIASELARAAVLAVISQKATLIGNLVNECHGASRRAGWYNDPRTGAELPRNVGEMLALIHSEVSEALEAYRKDLMDDKLPSRKGIEVELADAVIRIFDLAGYLGLDLGGAYVEKRAYNETRADHKPENRAKAGGKAF